MPSPQALTIRGLKKTYGNKLQALKGIDLDVAPGDFFALLGPNGAGKSTTIGIISSLVRKTEGSISVFGNDVDKAFSAAKMCLGVVPQEFNFNAFEKVQDIVMNQAGYYGLSRSKVRQNTEFLLKELSLWDKRNTPARQISGGMKRRLMIARALVHKPKLLILDEPTAGVDIELRRSMWTFLREINRAGTTIILTTHYLEEAENLCRNVAIINHGEIVENTSVKQLLTQLNKEVFVFDFKDALSSMPSVAGFSIVQVDGNSIEVEVERGQSLNGLIRGFDEQGLDVVSMRNKSNRLEELFVALVRDHHKDDKAEGAQA